MSTRKLLHTAVLVLTARRFSNSPAECIHTLAIKLGMSAANWGYTRVELLSRFYSISREDAMQLYYYTADSGIRGRLRAAYALVRMAMKYRC